MKNGDNNPKKKEKNQQRYLVVRKLGYLKYSQNALCWYTFLIILGTETCFMRSVGIPQDSMQTNSLRLGLLDSPYRLQNRNLLAILFVFKLHGLSFN